MNAQDILKKIKGNRPTPPEILEIGSKEQLLKELEEWVLIIPEGTDEHNLALETISKLKKNINKDYRNIMNELKKPFPKFDDA